MTCPDCKRLLDALLIHLKDEERRLKRRILYVDTPRKMTREEQLDYYKGKLVDIKDRQRRIKEQFRREEL